MSTVRARHTDNVRLRFSGTLQSEWIKLVTLRSTLWCYVIVVVLTVGLAALLRRSSRRRPPRAGLAGGGFGRRRAGSAVAPDLDRGGRVRPVGHRRARRPRDHGGVRHGHDPLHLLGRAEAPASARREGHRVRGRHVRGDRCGPGGRRAGLAPILVSRGIEPDFGDPDLWLGVLGAAGYLTLLGLLALAIGTIVRSTAAGIATAVGLVLVAPTVLQLVAGLTQADWARNVGTVLPSAAGGRLYAYQPEGSVTDGILELDATQGLLVLLGWVVLGFIAAVVLVKRRDA